MDSPDSARADLAPLRRSADETHVESADGGRVQRLLNDALADELVGWLRHRRHYVIAKGIRADVAAAGFLAHSTQEALHADQLATRIVELRGEPDFSPEGMLARSRTAYVRRGTLREMLREDLVAERAGIESCRESIRVLGDDDPATRELLERILVAGELRAEDLARQLYGNAGVSR